MDGIACFLPQSSMKVRHLKDNVTVICVFNQSSHYKSSIRITALATSGKHVRAMNTPLNHTFI